MRGGSWVAALVACTASAACGGRLVPERHLLPDGAPDPAFEVGLDGGQDGASDDAADVDARSDACAALPAPHCSPVATCGAMYLRRGEGILAGNFRFETVDVPCDLPPTVVEQWLDGEWKVLASLASATIPNTPSLDTYILGRQFPFTKPQEGTTVGSTQAIRACIVTDSCMTCDPPTDITVLSCGACLPKNCGPGKWLDEDCYCAKSFCPCPQDQAPACIIPAWVCGG